MVAFVTLGAAISVVAAIAEYTALRVTGDVIYTTAVGRSAVDAQAMLLLELQRGAHIINELVSGLWLLPLGSLAIRSGYFPRVVGALLVIGGVSWLAHLFVQVLAPDLTAAASPLIAGTVGELVFIVWLLVKGASPPRQTQTV